MTSHEKQTEITESEVPTEDSAMSGQPSQQVLAEKISQPAAKQCKNSKSTFKTYHQLKKHSTKSGIKRTCMEKVKCIFCLKIFPNYTRLGAHCQDSHLNNNGAFLTQWKGGFSSNNEGSKCYYCRKTYKKHDHLLKHYLKQHPFHFAVGGKQTRAESKKFNANSKAKILKNKLKNTTVLKSKSDTRFYKCRICASLFKTYQQLCDHQSTEGTQCYMAKCKCILCGALFTNNSQLKSHHTVCSANSHKCAYCPARYLHESGLSKHYQSGVHPHTLKGNTPRPVSGSVKSKPANRVDATRLSSVNAMGTPRTYTLHTCGYCCLKFWSDYEKVKHEIKVHNAVYANKCKWCDRQYKTTPDRYKHYLQDHYNLHFKYRCDLCLDGYLSNVEFVTHCKEKHPHINIPYSPNSKMIETTKDSHKGTEGKYYIATKSITTQQPFDEKTLHTKSKMCQSIATQQNMKGNVDYQALCSSDIDVPSPISESNIIEIKPIPDSNETLTENKDSGIKSGVDSKELSTQFAITQDARIKGSLEGLVVNILPDPPLIKDENLVNNDGKWSDGTKPQVKHELDDVENKHDDNSNKENTTKIEGDGTETAGKNFLDTVYVKIENVCKEYSENNENMKQDNCDKFQSNEENPDSKKKHSIDRDGKSPGTIFPAPRVLPNNNTMAANSQTAPYHTIMGTPLHSIKTGIPLPSKGTASTKSCNAENNMEVSDNKCPYTACRWQFVNYSHLKDHYKSEHHSDLPQLLKELYNVPCIYADCCAERFRCNTERYEHYLSDHYVTHQVGDIGGKGMGRPASLLNHNLPHQKDTINQKKDSVQLNGGGGKEVKYELTVTDTNNNNIMQEKVTAIMFWETD